MRMQPIVNGLKENYGAEMAFVEVNAGDDGDGEAAFNQKNLPGHPAYLIVQPDGKELWRGFGEQNMDRLELAIQDTLEN